MHYYKPKSIRLKIENLFIENEEQYPGGILMIKIWGSILWMFIGIQGLLIYTLIIGIKDIIKMFKDKKLD